MMRDMRHVFKPVFRTVTVAGVLSLGACQPADHTVDSAAITWPSSYPMDGDYRMSDGQVIGTHNSYHQEPDENVISAWAYTHRPLDEQLDLGVRQFEIDIVRDPANGELLVQHVPYLDDKSTCRSFEDCLTLLREWSDMHPWHFPLQILVEPKDEFPDWAVTDHFDDVDEIIEEIWGNKTWNPDAVQGDYQTLREAVTTDGWPALADSRGHAIFVLLDGGDPRNAYSTDLSHLDGRAMFVLADADHPLAAYFLQDNPASTEAIQELVSQGFLVRTRIDTDLELDPKRHSLAIESGAHALSTDVPEDLSLDAAHPVACNPVMSRKDCTPEDLE